MSTTQTAAEARHGKLALERAERRERNAAMTIARPINPWFKIAAAVAAVLCLSAPSAVGVFKALESTRGSIAAGMAAAGFELAYLSLSLLTLRPELRQQARRVALGAVITAIVLNGLADYGARVAGGLASWPAALRLFDPLALALAILESAPLAGLAYALASLLHRLAEEPADGVTAPAEEVVTPAAELVWARESYPNPELIAEATQASTEAWKASRTYTCPACGATLTAGQYGAARRHKHCHSCKA
jgi:hypothetical protein